MNEPAQRDSAGEGDSPDETRCGVIAVIGAPNAGKSTLVNALVGAKVSIVTHKVQTTRARVRGVATDSADQFVYIDTPGIFGPRRRLDRAMVAAAWEGLAGADVILLTVDAAAFAESLRARAPAASRKAAADTMAIVRGLKDARREAILVLNKVDKTPRRELLAVASALNEEGLFDETFMISAAKADGLDALRAAIARRLPAGPWLYPEDQLSDISDRLMAAEVTREKIYLRLHQELPYESTVETTVWRRTAKGELHIEQTIFVTRDSHKPIVLGKGGATLKAIGAAARAELAEIHGVPVHLFLHVAVRSGWQNDAARYREMGLGIVD